MSSTYDFNTDLIGRQSLSTGAGVYELKIYPLAGRCGEFAIREVNNLGGSRGGNKRRFCGDIDLYLERRKKRIKRERSFWIRFFSQNRNFKTFITFTFSGGDNTREYVVKRWRSFISSLKRRYKNLEYVAVVERGEKGRLHIHAIFNLNFGRYSPNDPRRGNFKYSPEMEENFVGYLGDYWKNGFIYTESIRGAYNLAKYLIKYMLKLAEDSEWYYKRLLFTSRGLRKKIIMYKFYIGSLKLLKEFFKEIKRIKEYYSLWVGSMWFGTGVLRYQFQL